MSAAAAVGLAFAAAALGRHGADEEGLKSALRLTARWSFLLFWLAYVGRASALLFGSRLEPLARRGREFGLAFASAQLVHVALIVWLYHIARRAPLSNASLVFFGVGLFWVYLLALLSLTQLARRLNPAVWAIVRTLGVEYIALVFLVDFAKNSFGGPLRSPLAYLPLLALAIAGPVLRLLARLRRAGERDGRDSIRLGPVAEMKATSDRSSCRVPTSKETSWHS
jgi:hypothetical protein